MKTGVVFLACFGLLLLNVEVNAQSQKDQKSENKIIDLIEERGFKAKAKKEE